MVPCEGAVVVTAADVIPQPCVVVIDGMAMVQKLNDMVYPDNSIKNAQREKRGSETGHEFRYIKADHKIHQW